MIKLIRQNDMAIERQNRAEYMKAPFPSSGDAPAEMRLAFPVPFGSGELERPWASCGLCACSCDQLPAGTVRAWYPQ
jgi:hypothetical protein